MLHTESAGIRRLLLGGKFGLEKEGLRVLSDGSMAHTPHPFADSIHITRDFSENQTEINTSVEPSARGAVETLDAYGRQMQRTLRALPVREYLWPFSNPPRIRGEEDIPVARFHGELASKTAYREYLSGRYGRYKMTYSGIHVNYSFSEELMKEEFGLRRGGRTRSFRDGFYLELAEKAAAYGWLLVILTAASPVLDGSFYAPDAAGEDVFSGMASVRCSELGYWNAFTPVFDYTDIRRYAGSIERYVDAGLLHSASELYYPIRLKPKGENSLQALRDGGVDHIELRMFDLNPLVPGGLDVRDVQFAQLFLVWLASLPRLALSELDQVMAVQNFKNAAHYDLKTVPIVLPGCADGTPAKTPLPAGTGRAMAGGPSVRPDAAPAGNALEAARQVLARMQSFWRGLQPGLPDWVPEVLDFEQGKLLDPGRRYAVQVRERFSGTFLEKGMAHARMLQEGCG